nr:MAG TPA: Putative HNHc nuclease [Bacteriophage sp.]DAO87709.1 MAG TPA: Putative HNHc nuclease [Caudoviricetes sp.]
MKTPVDTVKGRIVGYDERTQELLIRAHYDDWYTMTKRGYKECLVQPLDARPLSDRQRKMCYALLREISDYTGQDVHSAKEYLKLRFLADDFGETADRIFSLSNAPMSLVCAFQRYLVRFIVEYDIPCRVPLLEYVDDVHDYIYACLIAKKCCITGRPAELHHIDRVGMGRDRDDIIHEGMEVLPLYREMHQEAHTMGDREFFEKYHLPGGVVMDKTLCRIYKVKAKREVRQASG